MGLDAAFPDVQTLPSQFAKPNAVFYVSVYVALQLRRPVRLVGFGRVRDLATMRVPIAPMHEITLQRLGNTMSGLPGKIFAVKAVAVAERMQKQTDCELRSRVLAADASHVLAAALRIELIHAS